MTYLFIYNPFFLNLPLIIDEEENDKLIELSKYVIPSEVLFVNNSSISFIVFNDESNHIYM